MNQEENSTPNENSETEEQAVNNSDQPSQQETPPQPAVVDESELAKPTESDLSPSKPDTNIELEDMPDWMQPDEEAPNDGKATEKSEKPLVETDDSQNLVESSESNESPPENDDEVQEIKDDKAEEVKSDADATPELKGTELSGKPQVEDKKPQESSANLEPEDSKKHKIKSRKMSYPFNKMVANFAGCGRCSYFLAGYRVLHGELVLEKAVNRMKSNQLQLPWVDEMRKLIVNSFGIPFDIDFMRLNGRCPECGRPFTYKESLSQKNPNSTFTIQFNFKKR